MPTLEVNIPDQQDVQIQQFIEEGEFVDRNEAFEKLLRSGLKAYQTGPTEPESSQYGGGPEDEYGEFEDDYQF